MSGHPYAPPRGRLPVAAALTRRVRTRLELPLLRNGYALIASSAVTSVLGLVFWLVAARSYSPAAVGVSASLIAALTLLADLSHLNLKSALNRFLPTAGPGSARFARRAYLVSTGIAALAAGVFIAGLALWSPELAFLRERPAVAALFVAGTMAWTVFVLQDSVLAGIRQAAWVPAENLVFSVLKLVLLIVVASAAPLLGAFVSWAVAALVVVVPMNVILFRRLIPRHVAATAGHAAPVGARAIARYVAADYVAYAIWSATIGVLPLVVLHVSGAEASGYFYVSWAIAYSLYLASSGMGQSLLAEASLEPDRLAEHARAAALETARLVVPAVAVVVAAAPFVLGLLGGGYSDAAVTLLRLLALSAIPFVVVATAVSVMRVQRRMRAVIATYAALCALVLGVGVPLLATIGVAGLGVGWLVAQTAVAAVLVARRIEPARVVRALSAARRRVVRRWRLLGAAGELDTILREVAPDAVVRRHADGLNDVLVTFAGPRGGPPSIVVKRACSAAGEASLLRQERVLAALGRRGEVYRGGGRAAPRLLASGTVRGRRFLVETATPGRSAAATLCEGLPAEPFLQAARDAIRPLHTFTARPAVVDERLLDEWVAAPAARVRAALPRAAAAVDALEAELRGALAGRELTTAWVHGDLCPDNVMVGDDGTTVQGIVDWEQARRHGLPDADVMHLELTTRMAVGGRELGAVVRDLLGSVPAGDAPGEPGRPSPRTAVLLAWLGHVAGNLGKSGRYRRNRIWLRRNVEPVLEAVAPGAVAGAAAAALRATLPYAPLAAALGLWAYALGGIDVAAMSDLGLVSVLPPAFPVALVVLTVGFAVTAYGRPERTGVLVAHLLALVTVIHATPSILYDTLRYSWAWKHVGIVDFIERNGEVATDIDFLPVYHNWPGFFGVDALLGGVGGVEDMVAVASWGPLFFNVLGLAALLFLFSALTRDRRVLWAAAWLYFVASWVGQDYFSPQAFAFFLYVVLLGVVLRWLGRRDTSPTAGRAGPLAVALLLLVAIAASHALTSVMAVVALTAATVVGACAVRWLPLAAAAITVAWNVLFAGDYVGPNIQSTVDAIRLPWQTTTSSLSSTVELSDGQALVALLSRGLAAGVLALAAAGALRAWRSGRLHRAAAVLAAAPFALFASGDYGGELLFRIYLFALPFLAFLAAHAVAPSIGRWPARRSAAGFAAVALALSGLFLFAYYGKDRQYHFTAAEVEAAHWLYTHAPEGSLLIDGTRNYPVQFKNYERFSYVTLSREPASSHARYVADPAGVLGGWMDEGTHTASFVIITRSQKEEVEELGVMPPRSLDRIERALLASPRFRTVFRNGDAVVFAPADQPVPGVQRS